MKEFFSKLNLKDWIIVALFGLSLFFFIQYLTNPSGYKKRIKELEEDNRKIESKIDSLNSVNEKLKKESLIYISNINKYQAKIDSTQKLIDEKDVQISKSKIEMNKSKKEFENTKKEIEKLENNPIKRVGNDLINSLKEKTN